jgi:hypothetical protein
MWDHCPLAPTLTRQPTNPDVAPRLSMLIKHLRLRPPQTTLTHSLLRRLPDRFIRVVFSLLRRTLLTSPSLHCLIPTRSIHPTTINQHYFSSARQAFEILSNVLTFPNLCLSTVTMPASLSR